MIKKDRLDGKSRADTLVSHLGGWENYRDGGRAGTTTGEHEPKRSAATSLTPEAQRGVDDARYDASVQAAIALAKRRQQITAQQALNDHDVSGGWSKNSSAVRPS